MNKCKICEKETKNKVYCSTECQHKGYKELKVNRIVCICSYCDVRFNKTQYEISLGRGKYCSRNCKDSHQKELYVKDGNPVYGNKHSDEWKYNASIRVKKLWETEEFRNKISVGQERFFEENSFWCGCDEESLKKRLETNLIRFGVDNVSKLDITTKKRNETCLLKYGHNSSGFLTNNSKKNKNTKIELKIAQLLLENNIKFETQYEIYYKDWRLKAYYFYLKDFNLLIEADGDYWHGNLNKYNEIDLDEIQKASKENDIFKNNLAKDMGYNIIRFWETDINKKNFVYKLFNEIKKYGKKEN